MADFPIQFRTSDYQTEQNRLVRAKRGYLLCEFMGLPILCDGFIDTAAPFSVVPYTFSRYLPWTRLARSFTKAGAAAPAVLTWHGIPCEFGSIPLRWIHPATGLRSGPK
jgi:hypothetical protein